MYNVGCIRAVLVSSRLSHHLRDYSARFQYALPSFEGQLTASDINRIAAIFAKSLNDV